MDSPLHHGIKWAEIIHFGNIQHGASSRRKQSSLPSDIETVKPFSGLKIHPKTEKGHTAKVAMGNW